MSLQEGGSTQSQRAFCSDRSARICYLSIKVFSQTSNKVRPFDICQIQEWPDGKLPLRSMPDNRGRYLVALEYVLHTNEEPRQRLGGNGHVINYSRGRTAPFIRYHVGRTFRANAQYASNSSSPMARRAPKARRR